MARGAPNNMAYYNVPEVPGGGWICVRVQRTRCIELPHQASLIKCLYALSLCVCVCVCVLYPCTKSVCMLSYKISQKPTRC